MFPSLNISAAILVIISLSACTPLHKEVVSHPEHPGNPHLTSNDILNEVNAYRAKFGKKPLVRHKGLDEMAQHHAEFLRRNRGKFRILGVNVSHDGFDARTALARRRFNMEGVHENVAAIPERDSLVQAWIDSPPHRRGILGIWNHTGIGMVRDTDGMIFAVELFGSNAIINRGLPSTFGTF